VACPRASLRLTVNKRMNLQVQLMGLGGGEEFVGQFCSRVLLERDCHLGGSVERAALKSVAQPAEI
jgi:hypothetical protein